MSELVTGDAVVLGLRPARLPSRALASAIDLAVTFVVFIVVSVVLGIASAALDEAAVAEFCRGKLAHFKIPRYVDVRESFPMTVSGKIRKVEMREEAVARLGL